MKGENISIRLLQFGAQVLRMSKELPKDAAGRHILRQIVRSASGGGSNYEEARGAESRADFVHKASIAAKEVRETLYWLRLIEEAKLMEASLSALVREANELVAILTSSVRTAKSRDADDSTSARSWRTQGAREPNSFPLYVPSE